MEGGMDGWRGGCSCNITSAPSAPSALSSLRFWAYLPISCARSVGSVSAVYGFGLVCLPAVPVPLAPSAPLALSLSAP